MWLVQTTKCICRCQKICPSQKTFLLSGKQDYLSFFTLQCPTFYPKMWKNVTQNETISNCKNILQKLILYTIWKSKRNGKFLNTHNLVNDDEIHYLNISITPNALEAVTKTPIQQKPRHREFQYTILPDIQKEIYVTSPQIVLPNRNRKNVAKFFLWSQLPWNPSHITI